MSAILFGSISTLADTSELQRRAFNEAFAAHDLDWNWSRDDYRSMLASNGGADRIAEYAQSARASTSTPPPSTPRSREIFQQLLGDVGLTPRPGVVDTIDAAKANGLKVGLRDHHVAGQHRRAAGRAEPGRQRPRSFDVIVDAVRGRRSPSPTPRPTSSP